MKLLMRFYLIKLFKSKVTEQAVMQLVINERKDCAGKFDDNLRDQYYVNELFINKLTELLERK